MSSTLKQLGTFGKQSNERAYVFFPPAGGSAAALRSLADSCPAGRVYAVEYPGRAERVNDPWPEALDDLIVEIAGALLDPDESIDLRRTTFVGYSMGAHIALAVAQTTRQAPAGLVVIGASAPQCRPVTRAQPTDMEWAEFLADTGTPLLEKEFDTQEVLGYRINLLRKDFQLMASYQLTDATRLDCPIIALCGTRDRHVVPEEATTAWSEWTTNSFSGRMVSGGHLAFLAEGTESDLWQHLVPVSKPPTTPPIPPASDLKWYEFFQQHAARQPSQVALVVGDEKWTFSQLDELGNRLARRLWDEGACPGDIIACVFTRSAQAIISLLAVGKAQCVYLPVNPELADKRLSWLLADAEPKLVLTDLPDLCPKGYETRTLLFAENTWNSGLGEYSTHQESACDLESQAAVDSPAYIVYTSGSTGLPKGVVVGHASLTNLYRHLEANVFPLVKEVNGTIRLTHSLPLFFDAAWNPLLWMIGGYELHLLSNDIRIDSHAYVDYVREHNIAIIEGVPTLIAGLIDAGLLESKQPPTLLLIGGEPIGEALWSTLAAHPILRAVNLYGPTECTVFATSAQLAEHDKPSIGRPIAHVDYRLVDTSGEAVLPGRKGELLLGGACLALGYLNRTELTAEQFITDGDGARWYRTGDICRISDGALEFLGRRDEQVKIRGHRVEPSEIEHALLSLPAVTQTAVIAAEQLGSHRLIAHVVLAKDNPWADSPVALRRALSNELPDYLVPSSFVVTSGLPVNANGKIDRAALAARQIVPTTDHNATRPHTPAQHLVATAWEILFPSDEPDIHANFFDLGGHSLLAAQLAAALRAKGISCSLFDIFQKPTIAELSTLVLLPNDDSQSD